FAAAGAADQVDELALVHGQVEAVEHEVLALEDANVVQQDDRAVAHGRFKAPKISIDRCALLHRRSNRCTLVTIDRHKIGFRLLNTRRSLLATGIPSNTSAWISTPAAAQSPPAPPRTLIA